MTRVVLALLLVAGAVVAFGVLGRGPAAARAFERELARGPGHAFALADVTDFEWERVHLFGPYTARGEVEAALGFPWQGGFDSSIESSDGVVLVVFVRGGRVVEYFDLSRAPSDLGPCVEVARGGLTRAAARFVVGGDGSVGLGGAHSGD